MNSKYDKGGKSMSMGGKKWYGTLVILLAGAAGALGLTHFSYVATGYNMTVTVTTSINPNISGVSLSHGDEIGVFNTTGLCVGAQVWNGTGNIGIAVQGDDPDQDSIDGMMNGEKMSYRVWDSSLNVEVAAQVTYNSNKLLPLYADSLFVQDKIAYLTTLSGISPPSPLSPGTGAVSQPLSPTISWGSVGNAASYTLQVSAVTSFANTVFSGGSLAGTSQVVSGLANSTTYYWRTRTLNTTGGSSDWSRTDSFTTIVAAPAAAALSTPANGAANVPLSLSLNWNSSALATSYEAEVSLSSTFGSTLIDQTGASLTSLAVSAPSNSTTYFWRVNASNIGGMTWSGAWSFTTIIAAPQVPSLASPGTNAQNQPITPVLSWSTVATASTYAVQISTDAGFGSTVTAQIGLASPSASISGLANSTVYYWRAGAKNIGGVSGWSGLWSFTTIIAAPPVPSLAAPTNGAGSQPLSLSLSWNSAATAVSYHLTVSTAADFSTTLFSQGNLSGTTQAITGLSNSTVYYWRVGGKDIGGVSGWSGVWSFTTVVPAPGMPVLAAPMSGAVGQVLGVTLSWASTAGAATYNLQVASAADFSAVVAELPSLADTAASVAGLALNTQYYWRVTASNAGGNSLWSAGWSFTTQKQIALTVAANWNIVSMNIHACDSSFSCIIGSPGSFILAKDGLGNVYCPSWGVSDISSFRTGAGYQIYSSLPDTFKARGTAIDAASEPIALSKEWNLIAYLPDSNQSIESELFSITPLINIVKNNDGRIYWPDYGIDDIQTMEVGQGYQIYMKDDAVLTYGMSVYKKAAGGKKMLSLPDPHHYGKHATTGSNASVLAQLVSMGSRPVADSSEISAWDSRGNFVGAGMVVKGTAAFAVWGADQVNKQVPGCRAGEALTFKLWSGGQEYPIEFHPAAGSGGAVFKENAVLVGSLTVPSAALVTRFDLSRAYPNPFRGFVRIAFDVPECKDAAESDVTISVYDMKGAMIQQIAHGNYAAGHYSVTWNDAAVHGGAAGETMYIVRMKAANFDKRLKLIRIQ